MADPPPGTLSLAADFPAATRAQWLELVERVLKGERFQERLVAQTADGLAVQPLYARNADAQLTSARTPGARWRVMQRIDHPDPAAANAQALHELENGATGLSLEFAGGPGARAYGIEGTKETLARVFNGVALGQGVEIHLQPVLGYKNVGEEFAALVADRRVAPEAVKLAFNYQPLSTIAVRGGTPAPWSEMAAPLAKIIRDLANRGFQGPFALADGRPIHDAGGSEAQELAFALALAVEYLRALEAGGIPLDAARSALSFRLVADANQFLTTAKFRALRRLWARVEESCGLTPEPAFVAAETAWRTMTRDAPYENILRATIAVFAAGIGGADAITVLPFTAARGLPDEFARRIARNTQLILLDEANVARVVDPVAGTGWAEDLSDQLCRAAWTLFQDIEAAGGSAAALEQGLIQKKVAATRATRERALADGKDTLVGANEFRSRDVAAVSVLDLARVTLPPVPVAIPVEPLTPVRLAAPFEQL